VRLLRGNTYRCAPGGARTPDDVVATATLGPLPLTIPSTIAAACTNAGVWSMENPTFALDEFDWWVQIPLRSHSIQHAEVRTSALESSVMLRAEGLATLSEVWWNNELLSSANSMFVPSSVALPVSPVSKLNDFLPLRAAAASDETLADDSPLWLCFRSVSEHLQLTANRRDRPAWKSRLVDHQGLRRVRTSLLGRMPGWSPPVPAIGPYRPLHLSAVTDVGDCANLGNLSILSTVTPSPTLRHTGTIAVSVQAPQNSASATVRVHQPVLSTPGIPLADDSSSESPSLPEVLAESFAVCERTPASTSLTLSATVVLENVALWWPHTHGEPWLYPVSIAVKDSDGKEAVHQLASIGFRTIAVDRNTDRNTVGSANGSPDLNGFGIVINHEPVYARGACWTPVDIVSLNPSADLLDDTLDTMVASGMNMIRVGGTMTYETDRFHQRCDELGIMVWQDFMFANLDIPLDNEVLLNDIRTEVSHHAQRLGRHPSTVVVCGGSEVDQQASMMGIGAEQFASGLARSVVAPLCAQIIPSIPFVVSSPSAPPANNSSEPMPTGTPLPFHVDSGVGHYYGVGAYLRGFHDVRASNVRFAAECLAFANVPENSTLDALFSHRQAGSVAPHQPLWKQRVPRDNGAGWDFDDVRDHYLVELFGLDPMRLRYADLERWLDLSRITSSEVLDTVASEWRRAGSTCNGSLVWFLRDLWAGAGWGLIDALGRAKPALAGLARRWQPIALALTDEGVNGLDAHMVNETAQPLSGTLEAVIVRDGVTVVERAGRVLTVAPRSTQRVRVDELFDGFRDLTWAYRFGPAVGELVRVRFQSDTTLSFDPIVCDAHHWIGGRSHAMEAGIGLTAHGEAISGSDNFRLTIGSERTAFGVYLDGDEVRSSDNWFHLAPGDQRVLTVHRPRCATIPTHSSSPDGTIGQTFPKIVVRALNSRSSARVTW
jgi:beta-mannosidase